MNYPIIKHNKSNLLTPTNSTYSDEYAKRMCSLYLSDEVYLDENRHPKKYYRLHAQEAHSIEDALVYDIVCPDCSRSHLKLVGRMLDYNDLGLYTCPVCNKQ